MRWFVCLIASVSLLLGVLHANEVDQPDDMLDALLGKANVLMREGNFQEAEWVLLGLTREHPESKKAWYLLASVYYAQHDFLHAKTAIERVLKIDPEWQMGHWFHGAVFVGAKQLKQARLAYDRGVDVSKQMPGGYFQRARFLSQYFGSQSEQLEAALKDVEKAIQLGGPPDLMKTLQGQICRKLKRDKLAAECFQNALEHSATHIPALYEAVELFDQAHQHVSADALIEKFAARMSDQSPEASALVSFIRARHAVAKGMHSKVEQHFQDALQTMPRHDDMRLEYVHWLENQGRLGETVAVLEAGLKRSPNNPYMAAQLAWALVETTEKWDEAERWIQIALRKDPKSPYWGDTASWIEFRRGNYRNALARIQHSLPYAIQIPEIAYHAAAIYQKLEKPAEAARYLEIALKPNKPFYGREEAEALRQQIERMQIIVR